MSYRHGIYIQEVPTGILPPVQVESALPFVVGTAPVHLTEAADLSDKINRPVLCYSYDQFVSLLGYSTDWSKYSLCEFARCYFGLYNVGPVIFLNVLDPVSMGTAVVAADHALVAGAYTIDDEDAVLQSLVVKAAGGAGDPYVLGTDYDAAYNDDDQIVVTRIEGGAIATATTTISIAYKTIEGDETAAADIVGGSAAGAKTGLEAIENVYQLYAKVPSLIVAPGWSHSPTVMAAMVAKAGGYGGGFKATAIVDIDCSSTGVDIASEVTTWKSTNNYSDAHMIACWPKVVLGSGVDAVSYWMSSHVAGVIARTDATKGGDIPYWSPSNNRMQCNGLVDAAGNEIILSRDEANDLNGVGVVTAINLQGQWKAWGNRTSIYPTSTDPKDAFIPNRRMMDYLGNTIIVSWMQLVDYPIRRRTIQTIIESQNAWLNGLQGAEAILGGRVVFVSTENPTIDLIDGKVTLHLYVGLMSPAEEIVEILEFDPSYYQGLF